MAFTCGFKVIRTPPKEPGDDPEGNFYLFADRYEDHVALVNAVNQWVGKPVIGINGHGFGINIKLTDLNAWSDYVSEHVEEDRQDHYVFTMPDRPPVVRSKPA